METRCAVCQLHDGLVVNIIIAAPSDLPPDGTQLVEIMNGQLCDIGWTWTGTEFVPPVEVSLEPAILEDITSFPLDGG